MADYGVNYTDAELKKFEKKINTVYKQAEMDIKKKMKDFNAKYKIKEAKYLQQLHDGQITQEQFDSWKKGQVFQGKQWQAKKDQIADTLLNANKISADIMNGQMTNVFAVNASFMSYSLENKVGVNFGFGVYDSATVSNLLKNEPNILPKYQIKGVKDTAWNKKKVNRQVTLGIIEGESLDKIADRLGTTLGVQNKKAMLTQARTAMTSAQNAGREFSLQSAKDLGINVQKEWMCTLDGRTRDWHRMLDGQKQPLDKPFEVDGLKIKFPGDPEAVPGMVYNCRCTMVGDIVDYPSTYDRYDNIDGKPIKNMSYKEWESAKKKNKSSANAIINGKDISTTWKRRSDRFDFEIEDAINAQGFDGLPQVASPEEFEKAVQESQIIFNRGYTGPDQESIDKYHQELINGKWYLKCSGGNMNGYGMYTAGNYGTKLSERSLQTAEAYSNGMFGKIETMTLVKDSKIIKTDEIFNLKREETANYLFSKLSADGVNLSQVQIDMARMRCGLDVGNIWERFSPDEMKEANESLKPYYNKYLNDAFAYYEKFQNMDQGVYAAIKGYDALEVNIGANDRHFIVLNRTKLIVRKV